MMRATYGTHTRGRDTADSQQSEPPHMRHRPLCVWVDACACLGRLNCNAGVKLALRCCASPHTPPSPAIRCAALLSACHCTAPAADSRSRPPPTPCRSTR
eukprot:911839-Prymnesium_polylepis.1